MKASSDGFHDECGVFGIFDHPDAARLTYLGLYALQHRGQEAAGMVTAATDGLHIKKARGHVADVFDEESLQPLEGAPAAIGHVRYSTAGESTSINAQPLLIDCKFGEIAVCHNGNLVNAHILRNDLVSRGSIFRTGSDTEVILHLFARSDQKVVEDAVVDALRNLQGAFTLLFITPNALYGVRDPHGFRPLILGKLGDSHVLCSETCALDLIDATYVREIEPGEIVVIDGDGVDLSAPSQRKRTASAYSSTSTFPGQTASFSEEVFTSLASRWENGWRKRPPWTPTSWSRCQTPACSPLSDTRWLPAFRSSSASFAIITWAGPSLNRCSRSETSASRSSSIPSAPYSRAGGSCSSTIPSSAARPVRRSSAWYATPALGKYISASRLPPSPAPATTASTHRKKNNSSRHRTRLSKSNSF